MGDDADETERAGSDVSIAMRLAGWDVESDTGAHLLLAIRCVRYSLPFQDKDFVLIGMLMRLEDGSRLKLNHAHSEVGRALRLADEPADGLVLADRILGNVAVISTQHVYLQNSRLSGSDHLAALHW
jgi:hypothetical protein